MKTVKTVALILSLVLGTLTFASVPCEKDVAKFCKGVPPGSGRIISCLQAHQSELSESCQKVVSAYGEQLKQVVAACQPGQQGPDSPLYQAIQSKDPEVIMTTVAQDKSAVLSDACRASLNGLVSQVSAAVQSQAATVGYVPPVTTVSGTIPGPGYPANPAAMY